MSQMRRIPRPFVLPSYTRGAPEEEIESNRRAIPDTAEQMEFNIRYHAVLIPRLSSLPKDKLPDFQEDFAKPSSRGGYYWKGLDASVDNLACVTLTGSATQVGHQLALIGDEFNRTYYRKSEDTLLHLTHVVAISVFQTWDIIKSVLRSFGNILNNSWTKRIIGYGSWICRLPFRRVCRTVVPAALLAVAFWWALNYRLQN